MTKNSTELRELKASAPMLNKDDNAEEYDPHLHRVVPDATTNCQTLVHLLKGSLGTGILAMPEAFKQAGYISGILNTIIITAISTYCLILLTKNQYILCKRHRLPALSYPISMKMALEEGPACMRGLSHIAIPFVDGFLIVYQVGICCVYLVFVAANIKPLIDPFYEMDVKIYMVILIIPLIALMCIRNLKMLAPFSQVANVITFIGVGLIFYYIFKDGISAPSERIAFNSLVNFPLFFGTTLFAINAVGVVIAVENNMKTPKSFSLVLIEAMTVICILYAIFGFLGYLRYGEDCVGGSISLNLPNKEIPAQITKVIFILATFISFGLQGYVPVSIIWGTYLSKVFADSNKQIYYEFGVRIGIVLVSFVFAVAIPLIGQFISLVGALCIPVLGLACPALMDICVLHKENQLSIWMILKNLFFILVGVVGLVVGTYTSISDIVVNLTGPKESV